jgi:3-dehydroquinate synthase
MRKIYVDINENDFYEVRIERGLFSSIAENLMEKVDSFVIVTDSNVRRLYGEKLLRDFEGLAHLIDFPAGERNKNLDSHRRLRREILDINKREALNKKDLIVALGGGVVGDTAGYVAAKIKYPYVQVPTTLVAQVDSSIGGKVAVNGKVKNEYRDIYQPSRVYIDPDLLKTLSDRDVKNGLAEIVKYGIIKDEGILKELKEKKLDYLIEKCCRIKAEIVEKDEKDNGLRNILNYGHKVGHAIEKLSNYRIAHGEALAIGLALESEITNSLSKREIEKIEDLLVSLGLPTRLPAYITVDDVINELFRNSDFIGIEVPLRIGKMKEVNGRYRFDFNKEEVMSRLKDGNL